MRWYGRNGCFLTLHEICLLDAVSDVKTHLSCDLWRSVCMCGRRLTDSRCHTVSSTDTLTLLWHWHLTTDTCWCWLTVTWRGSADTVPGRCYLPQLVTNSRLNTTSISYLQVHAGTLTHEIQGLSSCDGNKTKILRPRPRPVEATARIHNRKNSSVATRIFVIKKLLCANKHQKSED